MPGTVLGAVSEVSEVNVLLALLGLTWGQEDVKQISRQIVERKNKVGGIYSRHVCQAGVVVFKGRSLR